MPLVLSAALGLRPYARPRVQSAEDCTQDLRQFFPLRTSRPVNNIFFGLLPTSLSLYKKTRGLEAFTRMIFFKFSGISLVSVGRVRPSNEIKSKW